MILLLQLLEVKFGIPDVSEFRTQKCWNSGQYVLEFRTNFKMVISLHSDLGFAHTFFSWLRVGLRYMFYFEAMYPTCTWARARAFL